MKTRTKAMLVIALVVAIVTASAAIQYRNVNTDILPAGTLVSIGLPPNDAYAHVASATVTFQEGNITLPDGRIVSSMTSDQIYVVRLP